MSSLDSCKLKPFSKSQPQKWFVLVSFEVNISMSEVLWPEAYEAKIAPLHEPPQRWILSEVLSPQATELVLIFVLFAVHISQYRTVSSVVVWGY